MSKSLYFSRKSYFPSKKNIFIAFLQGDRNKSLSIGPWISRALWSSQSCEICTKLWLQSTHFIYSKNMAKYLSKQSFVNCNEQKINHLHWYILVPDRAHFLSSFSFFEFQTIEFQHASSLNFAQVFRVLAWVIRVFQVFWARV